MAIIDYHTGDAYDNNYGLSRLSYYGLQGTPTAWFGGANQVVGGNHTTSMYGNYLPKYNLRKNIPSSFTIDVEGSNSGFIDYEMNVTIEMVDPVGSNNLVLHTVVTESDIAQNWQGQTELNHVERLMAPNQNGTPLDFSNNVVLEKTINFQMDPAWVTENCELILFVQDSQTKDIKQAIRRPLTDFGTTNQFDAAVLELIAPGSLCNNTMKPSVLIANYGLTNLTDLSFTIYVNDIEAATTTWSGNLAFGETAFVEFPEISNYTIEPTNVISVEAEAPNGEEDEFPSNNILAINADQAMNVTSPVSLALKLDENPQETSWELLNSEGMVLYEGGNYTTPNQFVVEQFILDDLDCYSFIIYDEGGDGLTGNGQYKLAYNGSSIFAEGFGFGYEDQIQFGIGLTGVSDVADLDNFQLFPNPVQDIAYINFELDHPAEVTLAVFNAHGESIFHSGKLNYSNGNYSLTMDGSSWSEGVYFVKLTIGDKIFTRKIVVK